MSLSFLPPYFDFSQMLLFFVTTNTMPVLKSCKHALLKSYASDYCGPLLVQCCIRIGHHWSQPKLKKRQFKQQL